MPRRRRPRSLRWAPLTLLLGLALAVAVTRTDASDASATRPNCSAPRNASENSLDQFPPDQFSQEDRLYRGALIVHVLGLVYMFVALAIVCDEFFVPSLGVITEKLQISDDVAGATFMAAGGSAPELFTSVIGVFIAESNVGIGTIVGSATFNILFVIAMCCIFSKSVLALTWWPLFRDVTFYVIDLALLVLFFMDQRIYWHEALIMLCMYVLYVAFMKNNERLERLVKCRLLGQKPAPAQLAQQPSGDTLASGGSLHSRQPLDQEARPGTGVRKRSARRPSVPIIHGGSMFRTGIIQLMVHTLDPMSEIPGTPDDEETFKTQVSSASHSPSRLGSSGRTRSTVVAPGMYVQSRAASAAENRHSAGMRGTTDKTKVMDLETSSQRPDSDTNAQDTKSNRNGTVENGRVDWQGGDGDEEAEEPLDLSWPKSCRKRISYLLLAPIVFPLWLTLPDVRRPTSRKWFVITFLGSILWIAFFSYLMVWWAAVIGYTIGISDSVMGLTILAAGTSIPDLITSVIVARKGLGDMAVSSSVGSNIFDVTVGLPLPWLMYFAYAAIQSRYEPIRVDSAGLVCSVGMLFLMLIVLTAAVAASRWHMSKWFGGVMLVSYFGFLVLSVMLEMRYITCFIQVTGSCTTQ